MDRDRRSLIGHAGLDVMSPVPAVAVERLVDVAGLAPDDDAVDIGAGKGAIALMVLARGLDVVLVERSPLFAALAEEAIARAGLAATGKVLREEAEAFVARARPGQLDLAICIGASHALGGRDAALKALAGLVMPGGQVLFGEGFWRKPPSPAYLQAMGASADDFGARAQNLAAAAALGLVLVDEEIAEAERGFDAYELGWCEGLERFAAAHPDDLDAAELRATATARRDLYTRWGRDELGFAVQLFRRAT